MWATWTTKRILVDLNASGTERTKLSIQEEEHDACLGGQSIPAGWLLRDPWHAQGGKLGPGSWPIPGFIFQWETFKFQAQETMFIFIGHEKAFAGVQR